MARSMSLGVPVKLGVRVMVPAGDPADGAAEPELFPDGVVSAAPAVPAGCLFSGGADLDLEGFKLAVTRSRSARAESRSDRSRSITAVGSGDVSGTGAVTPVFPQPGPCLFRSEPLSAHREPLCWSCRRPSCVKAELGSNREAGWVAATGIGLPTVLPAGRGLRTGVTVNVGPDSDGWVRPWPAGWISFSDSPERL
jgi:hypothetical protein